MLATSAFRTRKKGLLTVMADSALLQIQMRSKVDRIADLHPFAMFLKEVFPKIMITASVIYTTNVILIA